MAIQNNHSDLERLLREYERDFEGLKGLRWILVNICENRRRWRSDEGVGRVVWNNGSGKIWNQIPISIENRFMIFLWMGKMKNWLQFYQNILFWWIGETKIRKLLFIIPLMEIILQLVNFFLIWELICSLMAWLRIHSIFKLFCLFFIRFLLLFIVERIVKIKRSSIFLLKRFLFLVIIWIKSLNFS